jgi:hypothetical protein
LAWPFDPVRWQIAMSHSRSQPEQDSRTTETASNVKMTGNSSTAQKPDMRRSSRRPVLQILLALSSFMLPACFCAAQPTFTNPVLNPGQDPRPIQVNGTYYYIESYCDGNADICIQSSPSLTGSAGLFAAAPQVVWPNAVCKPAANAPNSAEIWAPELKYSNGTQSGDSTILWQIPCNGNAAQNWKFIPQGNSMFVIENQGATRNSAKPGKPLVIDVHGGERTQGLRMWLNYANGLSWQNWQLIQQ